MPSLFVANCTKHKHIFQYVPREGTKLVQLPINPGNQIKIEGLKDELDFILIGPRKYGYVEYCEVSKDKKFSGMCYQFDKPVKIESIQIAAEKRNDILDERAQNHRQAVVATINHTQDEQALREGAEVVNASIEVHELPNLQRQSKKPRLQQEVTFDRSIRGKRAARG